MNFLDFPKEIRLLVYSELLVRLGPVIFKEVYRPSSPLRFQHGLDGGLWLALLRVNKQVYGEARSVLYSNNSFQFPAIGALGPMPSASHCAQFLRQIGTEAATLIRHIGTTLPHFEPFEHNIIKLYEPLEKDLELIRDTCTGITTLELSLPVFHSLRIKQMEVDELGLGAADIVVQALALLDKRFKAIHSLKVIIIDFEVPYNGDEADKVYDDKLKEQMEETEGARQC